MGRFANVPINSEYLNGKATPGSLGALITTSFTRSGVNYLPEQSGLRSFSDTDGPRIRTRAVASRCDVLSHSDEISAGHNFVPLCLTADGSMYGYDSAATSKVYKLNGKTATLVGTLDGAVMSMSAEGNRVLICYQEAATLQFKLSVTDAGGAIYAVTISAGAVPDDTLIRPPTKWSWPALTKAGTKCFSTYDGGTAIYGTTSAANTFALAANDCRLKVETGKTIAIYWTASGSKSRTGLTVVSNTSGTVVVSGGSGDAWPADGTSIRIATIRSHDQFWRIPNFLTAAPNALTATFIKRHPADYDGTLQSHGHAAQYKASLDTLVWTTGDGYANTHVYLSTDDGLTFTEMGSAAIDWQDSYLFDDGDPTSLMTGSDIVNGVGRLPISAPVSGPRIQGALLQDTLSIEQGGNAWPYPYDGAGLVDGIWYANNILCFMSPGVLGGSGQSLKSSVFIFADIGSGEWVRYASTSYDDLVYVGIVGGRMHFSTRLSLTRGHISMALPSFLSLPAMVRSSQANNKASSTKATCDSLGDWTTDASLTMTADATVKYAGTASVKNVGSSLTGETQYGPSVTITGLTVAKWYVVEAWVYVTKAKRLAIRMNAGNGHQMPARWYSTTPGWNRIQSYPYLTNATSQTLQIQAVPTEDTKEIQFNIGALSFVRVDTTTPASGHWGAAGAAGIETFQLQFSATPPVFTVAMMVRWLCDYWMLKHARNPMLAIGNASIVNLYFDGGAVSVTPGTGPKATVVVGDALSLWKFQIGDTVDYYWSGGSALGLVIAGVSGSDITFTTNPGLPTTGAASSGMLIKASNQWVAVNDDASDKSQMHAATVDACLPRKNRVSLLLASMVGKMVSFTLIDPASPRSTRWTACASRQIALTTAIANDVGYVSGGDSNGANTIPHELLGLSVMDFVPGDDDVERLLANPDMRKWNPANLALSPTAFGQSGYAYGAR